MLRNPFNATRGIGTELAVLLLIALVPAFLLQVFLHAQRFQSEYQDQQDTSLELAYSVGSAFEAHLDLAAAQANALSETLLSLRPFTPERASAYLADNIGRYPALLSFHWATPQGRILASSDRRSNDTQVADPGFYARVLRQREWVLGDWIPNDHERQPLVILARAVSGRNGSEGILIASVQPGRLMPHRFGVPVNGTDWVIIDSKGIPVFAASDPSVWKRPPRDLPASPLVAAALRGKEAVGVEPSPVTGENRLVARVPIGKLGWVAGVGRSRSTVLSPLQHDLLLSLLLSLAVAFFSGLLAQRLGRKVVVDVGRLQDSVAALMRGQVPQKPEPVGSLAELQALAESFHRMAVHRAAVEESLRRSEMRLQEFNLQLEQRVQERTERVQQQAAQLRALAVELARAEQQERRRLAGILHDHVQQLLVAVRMQLSVLQREPLSASGRETLALADKLVDECIQDCRSLTVELSPPVLYSAGLAAALEWLARRLEEQNRFGVEVHVDPHGVPQDPDLRDFLFNAVRELLFNAVKHSGAHCARVDIRREGAGQTRITVEDHGRGFDPAEYLAGGRSAGKYGLFSIRERLEHLGGRMEMTGAPGRGLTVTLRVPLEAGEGGGTSAATGAAPTSG